MPSADSSAHAGQTLGFERFIFFSDAVFAIAITLLVLDLKPPISAGGVFSITPVIPNLIGFALSFYVVGRYWIAHHRLFEAVRGYDGRLLSMNLVFLAAIVFLPFPTSVVAEAKAETGPVMLYTLSLGAVGVLMVALALVARRPSLMRPGETRGGTARIVVSMAAAPLVFIAAAALSLQSASLALYFLLSLIPAGWAADRLGPLLQRRIDAA